MAYTGPDGASSKQSAKRDSKRREKRRDRSRKLQNYWREKDSGVSFCTILCFLFGMSGPCVCIPIFVPGVSSLHTYLDGSTVIADGTLFVSLLVAQSGMDCLLAMILLSNLLGHGEPGMPCGYGKLPRVLAMPGWTSEEPPPPPMLELRLLLAITTAASLALRFIGILVGVTEDIVVNNTLAVDCSLSGVVVVVVVSVVLLEKSCFWLCAKQKRKKKEEALCRWSSSGGHACRTFSWNWWHLMNGQGPKTNEFQRKTVRNSAFLLCCLDLQDEEEIWGNNKPKGRETVFCCCSFTSSFTKSWGWLWIITSDN